MISAMIYGHELSEIYLISQIVKELIAARTDEESHISVCYTRGELCEALEHCDIEDIIFLDIRNEGDIDIAVRIRKKYPAARLMLVADRSVSPEHYILPSIMASSLLIRPYSGNSLQNRIRIFMETVFRPLEEENSGAFVLETREGVTKIPYPSIYCFESNRKKIYIRLKNEEYSYYGTLDQLAAELPDFFVRCHRSFIINKKHLVKYLTASNLIILGDKTEIPVSRSYKNYLREKLK